MNILVVSTANSKYLVPIKDIISCQNKDNKVVFHLVNNEMIESNQQLSHFESQLMNSNFFRPDNLHLVNINFIETILHKDRTIIILSNSMKIRVNQDQQDNLFRIIENM
ncbi:MAG: LytTR family transcriptional regulator DNA-binding domain-containing protein [Salinivirgaceae bacterium]|nr:LytTR family transcriptional regulator DNA-binding domain-containing protein [Salinivirgaceae bacterium]